jgi:hypothetical protein
MFGRDGFNLFYFLYYPHHHVYFIHLKISKKKITLENTLSF